MKLPQILKTRFIQAFANPNKNLIFVVKLQKMTNTITQPSLNSTQMMLLRLFSRDVPEQRMKEIKKLLLNYYTEKMHEEVENAIAEKNITDADIDAILYQQQRTK